MKIVLLEELGVSNSIIEKYREKLEKMGNQFISYKKDLDINTQIKRVKDADALIIANMPLDKKVLENAKKLKFIDVAFTGVDHIPLDVAKQKNIAVSNASGYATQAVAELCISFMIQLLRKIKENEVNCREGKTKIVGNLLQGKTVGIIGVGKIGKRVAHLCKAFGCKVIVYNRSIVNDNSIDKQVELKELLQESDIVSLHCPLTNKTEGMIEKKELSLMKKTAILINTARGNIVKSEDLKEALETGVISGAACDVFEEEPPLSPDYNLIHPKNIILTPHMAFASIESLEERAEIVFDNLFSWLDGKQKNKIL